MLVATHVVQAPSQVAGMLVEELEAGLEPPQKLVADGCFETDMWRPRVGESAEFVVSALSDATLKQHVVAAFSPWQSARAIAQNELFRLT